MPEDTFICGECSSCFFEIQDFIEHKKKPCQKKEETPDETTPPAAEVVPTSIATEATPSVDTDLAQPTDDGAAAQHPEIVLLLDDNNKRGSSEIHVEVIVHDDEVNTAEYLEMPVTTKKRGRGRPKKSIKLEPGITLSQLKTPAETGKDGQLVCPSCRKEFRRERHYITHKCLATAGFVDITKKDSIKVEISQADDENDEDYAAEDDQQEAVVEKRGRKRGRKPKTEISVKDFDKVETKSRQRDEIPDLPVFDTEEGRIEFEENLMVDLSVIDYMFRVHSIDQEINEEGGEQANRYKEKLTIYSCNKCDKVFKSLSHTRLHCISHTDLKPFRCNKCKFMTNAKGNLYAHMRKHTGMTYSCSNTQCTFVTVNKSHLAEHEEIHSGIKKICDLCKHEYSTTKSLINHVRKYHNRTKQGRDYLTSFQGKYQRGAAILHQCHVCNRKFKKKIDRDRHLFVHNIRVASVQDCDACEYVANRKTYLDKHYLSRHGMVFRCFYCQTKLCSTIRLNNHLKDNHPEEFNATGLQELFQKCIEVSVYLKEMISNATVFTYDEMTGQPVPQETVTTTDGAEVQDKVFDPEDPAHPLAEWPEVYRKLNYSPLTLAIFQQLRTMYGNEECEYCGKLFITKTEAEPHIRTHTGVKPYGCDLCPYRANTRDNLRRHIEKIHEKVTYPCSEAGCMFIANSRTQLWTHIRKHKIDPIKCSLCDRNLYTKRTLRSHILYAHRDVDPNTDQTLAPKRQGKFGRKSYKCPYCERVFLRYGSELRKHMWVHQGIKPYRCSMCPHTCRTKSNLDSHMLKHSNLKPYLCNNCGKDYKSRTALRWHVRTHIHGKSFKCPKCSYEGVQKSHLVRHMETHNVLKKFRCQICDFSCNTLGYLKIHCTRNHKGSLGNGPIIVHPQSPLQDDVNPNTKVYKCLSCDYIFGNFTDMKRHLKVRHHIDVGDIHCLDGEVTRFVSNDQPADDKTDYQVQVYQVPPEEEAASQEVEQPTQEEKVASILQQIIDISQQTGNPEQQHEILVQADTETLSLDPEAIIVQNAVDIPEDQTEIVATGEMISHEDQYTLIQYVNASGETVTVDSSGAQVAIEMDNVEETVPPSGGDLITLEAEVIGNSPSNVLEETVS